MSLWWPVGYDEQALYDSKVELLDKENSSPKAYRNPNCRVPSELARGTRSVRWNLLFFPEFNLRCRYLIIVMKERDHNSIKLVIERRLERNRASGKVSMRTMRRWRVI
ncbi:hypothetical protein PM082_011049 [Marasmius tenuissimus]|nr:hypothetical protein PM082_011049 [Marasmius tenuissimus]